MLHYWQILLYIFRPDMLNISPSELPDSSGQDDGRATKNLIPIVANTLDSHNPAIIDKKHILG